MTFECLDTNPSSAKVWRILFPDRCDGIFSRRPAKKKTIVSMAVLLEPSEYNLVDIDSTWGRLAVKEKRFGTFGEFDQEDFVTSGKFSVVSMN